MVKKVYLDTSALLPYYRDERHANKIQKFLSRMDPPGLISSFTRVEFASAIARWVRMNELNEAEAGLIENTFFEDVKTGLFVEQSVSTKHFKQAERWISTRKTGLRTLEALHLACSWSAEAEMITCDRMLHQSAQQLGISSRLL